MKATVFLRLLVLWLGIGIFCLYIYNFFKSPLTNNTREDLQDVTAQLLEGSEKDVSAQPAPVINFVNVSIYSINEGTIINTDVFDPASLTKFDQKDPALLPFVRKYYIKDPPKNAKKHNSKPTMVLRVWPLLKKIVDGDKGFFVEAGANNGISGSQTLWLEQKQGWNGLLVECHPKLVKELISKKRNAYLSNVCLGKTSHPDLSVLTSPNNWHASSTFNDEAKNWAGVPGLEKGFTKFTVPTIPLYALLAAINVTVVDYFALDIQSLEYEVLLTFPFDLIKVKVWLIETVLYLPEELKNLNYLMKKNGYDGPLSFNNGYDSFYVLKSLNASLF